MNTYTRSSVALLALVAIIGGAYYYRAQTPQIASPSTDASSIRDAAVWELAEPPFSVLGIPHQYTPSSGTWYWYSSPSTAASDTTGLIGDIHCMESTLTGVDIATFAPSIGGYGKDKNHVFRCDEIVQDADPTSFTVLNSAYAKDHTHVFYGGDVVRGANSARFMIVTAPIPVSAADTQYGKDDVHVYLDGKEIVGADSSTFTILGSFVAVDKNSIYTSDKRVGPISLIAENEQYAHVLPQQCKDIDPAFYPELFSEDGKVIGYTSAKAVCIIDKKTSRVDRYEYGSDNGVDLSKDGSRLTYHIYMNESQETCADCGQYSINRATGKVERMP